MKKLFIISSVLFVVVLIVWGVYYFFFVNNPYNAVAYPEKLVVAQPKTASKEPVSEGIFSGKPIKQVVKEPVFAASFDMSGNTLWFIGADGKTLKKLDVLSGQESVVLDLGYQPESIRWSPDRTKFLASEKDNNQVWHLVSFDSKQDTPVKTGIKSPVWTNVGDRIIYEYASSKTRSIDIANPDGSNWRTLMDLPAKIPFSFQPIPQTGLLAVWNAPGAFFETTLRTVSLAGGDPEEVFSGKFGTDYTFSPDGATILAMSSNQKGGGKTVFGTMNVNGGEYRTLDVPTLVAKTLWSTDSKTVYYALPGTFPENVVLPDDYDKGVAVTQDTFWRVDVTTGQKKRLVELQDMDSAYDAADFFLDPTNTYLLFINQTDRHLYRIKL